MPGVSPHRGDNAVRRLRPGRRGPRRDGALYDGNGESALGGIRAGKQDPLFTQGNAYLRTNFPRLDYIRTARGEQP